MKKNIKKILKKYTPSILLLVLVVLQAISSGYLNFLLFVFIYSSVFYCIFMEEKKLSLIIVFISGLTLDAVNDVIFGLSSFIFMIMYIICKIEMRYLKTKDFLSAYMFYSINIISMMLFVKILSIFVNVNFVSPISFILWSLLMFPLLYNIIRLYKTTTPKF